MRNDGQMIESDIKMQTKQVLDNLKNILEEANSSIDCIVKTTIFLINMDDFDAMNEVYEQYFLNHKPARSTICVKELPKKSLIEIECIAYKN